LAIAVASVTDDIAIVIVVALTLTACGGVAAVQRAAVLTV